MKKFLAIALTLCMLLACITACAPADQKDPNNDGTEINKGELPTLNYLYNTSDNHKAIGEYLQAAVKTVGITMNMENQEWAVFLETRKAGNFSVARNGWVADYSDPICFLDMWTSGSGNNDVQFGKGAHKDLAMYSIDLSKWGGENVKDGTWAQTYDVLISMIKNEVDATKRYEMMHAAEDMLMDTGCIVPLYFYTDLYMLSESVEGFFSNPLGYKYFHKTTVDGNGDSLSVCLASEPQTLDPALNSAVDGATLLAHLFSGLAKWEQDESGKLIVVADAAESLTEGVTNEDGTVTYTYTLKDGQKWSNGADVTAADFVYAWKRAASTTLAADYGYMFEVVKGYGEEDVDGLAPLAVEAVDEKTIKVTLNNAVSYWNELLAFPVYFPVYKDAVANEAWATEPSTYVCNGAYTMTSWEHKSVITLTKNAVYLGQADVSMNEIKFYLSDDNNNMLTNFKNGSWLLIDEVPTNEIANLKKDYPTEFVVAGQIGTYYVCWNINEEILPANSGLTGVAAEKARQEIRKAIGLLFDRNHIVENIAQGGQVPASSFVAMGMFNPDGTEFYKTANGGDSKGYYGYYDVSPEAYESNCIKARETLQKYYNNVTVSD